MVFEKKRLDTADIRRLNLPMTCCRADSFFLGGGGGRGDNNMLCGYEDGRVISMSGRLILEIK